VEDFEHRHRIFRKKSWTGQEREVNLYSSRSVERVGRTACMSTANSIGVVYILPQYQRYLDHPPPVATTTSSHGNDSCSTVPDAPDQQHQITTSSSKPSSPLHASISLDDSDWEIDDKAGLRRYHLEFARPADIPKPAEFSQPDNVYCLVRYTSWHDVCGDILCSNWVLLHDNDEPHAYSSCRRNRGNIRADVREGIHLTMRRPVSYGRRKTRPAAYGPFDPRKCKRHIIIYQEVRREKFLNHLANRRAGILK
jgi:hypothetical protein